LTIRTTFLASFRRRHNLFVWWLAADLELFVLFNHGLGGFGGFQFSSYFGGGLVVVLAVVVCGF
jgi:hypothetical protein